MTQAVAARPRWMITTQRTGEVLAAGAESDESQILLLGIPSGFTPAEIEGWLQDLIGVSRETSRQDTDERPIPVLLHHTLTGLLFSHTELWDRAAGAQPCSVVFVQLPEAAGFGWVGEAEPAVRINGESVEVQWVRVRDHSGREARAFAVDARHDVEVDLEWSELPGATDVPGIAVSARWSRSRESAAPAVPEFEEVVQEEAEPEPKPAAYAPVAAEVELPDVMPSPDMPAVFGMPGLPPGRMPERLPTTDGLEPMLEPAPPEPDFALESIAMPAAPQPAAARETEAGFDPEPGLEPEIGYEPQPPAREARVAPEAVLLSEEPATGEPVAAPSATHPALTPNPARPLGWTTVYEAEPPAEITRDPIKDERRRGFFSWIASLMRGRAKPEEEDTGLPKPLPPRLAGDPHPAAAAAPEPQAPVRAAEPAPMPPIAEAERPRKVTSLRRPSLNVGAEDLAPPIAPAAPVTPVAPVARPAELLPEMVPPTPEPAELTARTVDWRAVQTPGPAIATPEEVTPEPAHVAAAEEQPSPPRWTRPARSWPSLDEPPPQRPALFKKPWAWGVLVAALFAGGWLVGALQEDRSVAGRPNPVTRALRAIGIGGARYDVVIATRPAGAWISVDGKDLARRTPATIELAPGEHLVTLTLGDLGGASFNVRGERGDRVALDAPLFGSLAIRGSDSGMPIAVSVDGRSLGFVPITLDSLAPGPHEVRYSGPGMASWGSTVTVKVGELSETIAHPMTSPATGVIEVRALAAGSEGSEPLSGARVWVDGERRGATPVTLELPRGPHSVRVEYQGESAPVQVIDLPGGNQRFATFEFGLDIERGKLVPIAPPGKIPLDRPTTISAALQGVNPSEVREMWLHVRTPDGSWRRYQMAMLKATGGIVGVAVYPPTMFDEAGRGRWYVSSVTQTGDEYFTEILSSELAEPPARAR